MKFLLAGVVALAAGIAVLPSAAQSSQSPQPAQQPAQTTPKLPGQVIFSRSEGQTATTAGPAAPQTTVKAEAKPVATDTEREAIRFSAYDMDVHVETAERHIGVRALMTVRNAGSAPLKRIPLQISSSLTWDRIRADGQDVKFPVATINSDADHTGQLHEAAVPLATPLAPGQSVKLDVTYSGDIVPNAKRLLAIGTPSRDALRADWDGIGIDFTGLRGFGDVVWYPVSSVPALLGNGAQLFNEIGRQKLHLTGTSFSLRLTVEFPSGKAPTVAVIDGHAIPLKVTDRGTYNLPGVATASLDHSTLGFEAPSLFLAIRNHHALNNINLWTVPADDPAVSSWSAADTMVMPFLKGWLGDKPSRQLTILDLPDVDDTPYEDGPFLATGVMPGAASRIANILAHALTHAYLQSPQAWLNEGVADFMSTLWIERQQGRAKALGSLEAARPALALVEPSSPGISSGEPLTQAYTPAYYRTKAAYVFWMLRNLTSEQTLSKALRAYIAAQDATAASGKATDPSFQELLKEAGSQRDLSWFFNQWVNADYGLPDLRIDHVYPSAVDAGNWLVAIDMSNSGYAAAEVPLTVTSTATSLTRRVMIPAQGKIVKRILIQGKPTQVQLNDGSVPEVAASVHVTHLDSGGSSSSSAKQAGQPQ